MPYTCAWCLKPGAEYKTPLNTDGSCSGFRYFCGQPHMMNWINNVPRRVPIGVPVKAASIWEIIKQGNLDGWFLVALSQYGVRENIQYRATFQHRKPSGATEEVFACFSDSPDPRLAVLGAYEDAMRYTSKQNMLLGPALHPAKLTTRADAGTIPTKLAARLDKALDDNWAARKRYGTRSHN